MKTLTLLTALLTALFVPALSLADEQARCSPETEEAISAILDLDLNAPGKDIVGEQIADLIAQCEKESRENQKLR